MIGLVFTAAAALAAAPADVQALAPTEPAVLPVAASPVSESPITAAPDPALPTQPETPVPVTPPPVHIPGGAAPDNSEILVTAIPRVKEDPLQEVNAASFEATQAVDKAFVRPAAMAYRKVFPRPIRSGVRNFLTNLTEPVVFVNYLLQLKPGKAAETLGRFAVNSTIGAAGLVDVAKRKPFNLPHRPNGFAYTLGYYGVKSGPFLYLPLIGPTTLRDVIGLGLDRAFLPTVVGKPFNSPYYAIPSGVLTSLDQRAEFDSRLERIHSSDRPYAATREEYLQNRQAEIDALHSKPKKTDALEPEPIKAVPQH